MSDYPSELDEREAEEAGLAHLDRLAISGTLVEPKPIRHRYGRDLLGWIGIIVAAGGIALGLAWLMAPL